MKNHCTRFVKTFHFVEEHLSSPLSDHILDFYESDLFQETMQNSEVASSSNCCYEEQSSYPPDIINATTTTATTTANFPLMFEEEIMENDISTPIDLANASHFTNHQYPFANQDQFDLDLLQNQIPMTIATNDDTKVEPIFSYSDTVLNDHVGPTIGPTPLPTVCEEDNLSSMPPLKLMRLNNCLSPNYSFINPSINSYLPRSMEDSGIFKENLFDIKPPKLEFHGDNGGILCSNPPPHAYNSNEFQALSNESRHVVNGGQTSTTPLVSEITSLESDTYRVATKLTAEERKEKINRYLKKRKERNFKKKIKYACRKTLADSRPRVRGRFAKNDEFGFGENNRSNSNDTDENGRSFDQHVVKDEEESYESSDIIAYMSGLNSFNKCKFPVWI